MGLFILVGFGVFGLSFWGVFDYFWVWCDEVVGVNLDGGYVVVFGVGSSEVVGYVVWVVDFVELEIWERSGRWVREVLEWGEKMVVDGSREVVCYE